MNASEITLWDFYTIISSFVCCSVFIGVFVPPDPKQKKISTAKDSDKNTADAPATATAKEESSGSGMGGMIGEGRANEGSTGGMKGEQ